MNNDQGEDPTRRGVMAGATGTVLAATGAGEATAKTSEISSMGGTALAAGDPRSQGFGARAMAACLAQIEAVNPAVNAVISMPTLSADGRGGRPPMNTRRTARRWDPCTACRMPMKDLQAVKGLRFTRARRSTRTASRRATA